MEMMNEDDEDNNIANQLPFEEKEVDESQCNNRLAELPDLKNSAFDDNFEQPSFSSINQENFKPSALTQRSKEQQEVESPVCSQQDDGKLVCGECSKPIRDRYVMRLLHTSKRVVRTTSGLEASSEKALHFHENCLKCHQCQCPLDKSCFIRGTRLLCRQDYYSNTQSGPKCIACSRSIAPVELVMRVESNKSVYHLACFTCFLCARPLRKGDRYLVLDNGRALCTQHNHQQPVMDQSNLTVQSAPFESQHNQQQQQQQQQQQDQQFGQLAKFESIISNQFNASNDHYHNHQTLYNVIQRRPSTGQSLLTSQPANQADLEDQQYFLPETQLNRQQPPEVGKRAELNGRGQHSPLLSLSGVVDSLDGSHSLQVAEEEFSRLANKLPVSTPDVKNAQSHMMGVSKSSKASPAAGARNTSHQRNQTLSSNKPRNSKTNSQLVGQQQQQQSGSQHRQQMGNMTNTSGTRIDGRRGPKRPRTILTTSQRREFRAAFDITPKPSRKARDQLSMATGLSPRIVQVWFQNQRAKLKKIQRKQVPQGGHSTSSVSSSPRTGGAPLNSQLGSVELSQPHQHSHHHHQHHQSHHNLHHLTHKQLATNDDFMARQLLEQSQPQSQSICQISSTTSVNQQYPISSSNQLMSTGGNLTSLNQSGDSKKRRPANRSLHESEGETSRSMSELESVDSDELDEEDEAMEDEEEEDEDEDDDEVEEEDENEDEEEDQESQLSSKRKQLASSSNNLHASEQADLFGANNHEINSTDNRKM